MAGFELQVDLAPHGLAVRSEASTWSYAELDARANAVAHLLLGAGALSGRPVAIVLPTGAEVIAAILGVLKAGGIYVVLDPGHPRTRNEHIASDASPAVFLTNQAGVAVAQEIALPTTPVLLIEHAARARTDRPGVMILPDDPAWLIYTSGSTGRPKGVVQSHRHAVHNVWRQQRLAQWSPSDRMTWLYSPGVMGATRGLTAALLHGASLFPRDPRQESPATFIQWLRDERITVYHSVASLFRNVFGLLSEPASLPEVRLAIFGGERVGAVELDLLRRHLPADARVYTGLGTTETGTVSHVLVDPVAAGHGPLPLGRPVEGVTIELRDENGGRIPPGGVGEIVVASEHLALRYWREPAGLRPAFAPDPLHPQVRVYRTGDLGRFDGDGMLRHAGRKDFQVKIRGFRVEVAEIEFALQDHPGVNEAAVVGRPDAQGECRLAAYCVARSAPGPAAGELRRFLEARLPRHLVPTTFAVLAGLPRTPNGKLDRLALPDGVEESGAASDIFVAPQGSMEQKLAAIWTGVLGRARVSRHDDFFALGGHSLAAMQVAARIGAEFDIDLAPREIFASPVLSDLAMRVATVATGPRRAAHQMLLARPPGSRPCLSFAQESLWFIDQLEPRSPTYHIVRAFQIRGPIDLPALDRALQTIVSRHEPLRTVIELVDGAPRARLRDHEVVPLRVVWHRGDPAAFVAAESARPFDLSADLLLRAAFGRNGDGGVLVLTLHHVAGDAWSVANILREMSVLYTGFSTGSGRAELPPLAVSYSDFAAWQRGRLAPPDLEREVAFWRRTLASAPPLLELPCDFPRPSQSTGRAAVHRFAFPAATAEAMEELATHGRVTPFVVWLAAFQVLLSRHAGVSDVVVAAPVSGRSRVELEPLIGFFVDTLLFRGDLSGDPGFADFVARLGRHATEVFAHGDLPFAQLVQALQPERTGTQAPLAQVMFAWQNAPRAPLELGSAEVTPLETSAPGAKFDLTLVMEGTETGLRASFEYRSDLFHPTTITRLARRFTALVQGILAEPGTPCHRLPLLPEAEMRQLDEWSGADATLASPDTVRAGWARQVARTPAAIALRAAGEELSYAELDAAADRVASHLLTLGVQRGDRVALAVGRRLELGAAMLGAWKVGAAFVPLDPSYPRSRLEFMLSDSGTRVIIAPAAASAEWRPLGVPVLEMELAATRGEPARPVPLQPEDLAYVIYTSGSTGRPKGVPIPHRALWQHHQAVGAEFALGPGDRVLQFSALSFDASLEEIFPT